MTLSSPRPRVTLALVGFVSLFGGLGATPVHAQRYIPLGPVNSRVYQQQMAQAMYPQQMALASQVYQLQMARSQVTNQLNSINGSYNRQIFTIQQTVNRLHQLDRKGKDDTNSKTIIVLDAQIRQLSNERDGRLLPLLQYQQQLTAQLAGYGVR